MFAGSLRFDGASPGSAADALDFLTPYHQPDLEGAWRSGPASLAEHRFADGTATRDGAIPVRDDPTGVALAFWGRLHDRSALVRELAAEAGEPATDARLVLTAWKRWGRDLCHHLTGDFALAVLDVRRGRALLARDPLGVKPLYYLLDGHQLVFATSVAALRRFPGLALTPDPDWMARSIAGLGASPTQTGYQGVLKLPPGHVLEVGEDGRGHLSAWHAWRDDAPVAARRDPRWVHDYRQSLEEAVRCRLPAGSPLGTENSGGLDSATVTALAARLLEPPGDRLHTFGFALHRDEPQRILATSRAHGIVHNHMLTVRSRDERLAARDRALRVIGYPEMAGIAAGHAPFYRECELHGIRTLLSGFGGDQVVTSAARLVHSELLDAGRWADLWETLPGSRARRAFELARRALADKRMPGPNPGLAASLHAIWPHQLLRADVAQKLGIYNELLQQTYFSTPYRRINDFILHRHLAGTNIVVRIESCTLVAASYGVEYRWPLLDARLIQQYLSTPSIEKLGPQGMGRYLHRRAVAGVVPECIVWDPTKNVGPMMARHPDRSEMLAISLAKARELERALHPALDELIDRDKLRAQMERVAASAADDALAFSFPGSVSKLGLMQAWLQGDSSR